MSEPEKLTDEGIAELVSELQREEHWLRRDGYSDLAAYTAAAVEGLRELAHLRAQIKAMREWLQEHRDHQYAAMQRYVEWKTESDKQHWNIHAHKAGSFRDALDKFTTLFHDDTTDPAAAHRREGPA